MVSYGNFNSTSKKLHIFCNLLSGIAIIVFFLILFKSSQKKVAQLMVIRSHQVDKEAPSTATQTQKKHAIPSEKYIVPNIVHYVLFGNNPEWHFHYMLSVKSAFLNIKPEAIFLHCDTIPRGTWWNYTKEHVPILKIIKANPPKEIFGNRLTHLEHSADIYRYQILLKMGGIYMDLDVIALNSFGPLRKFEFTLGLESQYHLGNGVIISAINASFLNIWLDSYKSYSSAEYNVHSVIVPFILSLKYPVLIHIEEGNINYPDWSDHGLDLLYNKIYDWSKNYCIHIWYRLHKRNYNPKYIKTLNSTFGQIARFIFFNERGTEVNKEIEN